MVRPKECFFFLHFFCLSLSLYKVLCKYLKQTTTTTTTAWFLCKVTLYVVWKIIKCRHEEMVALVQSCNIVLFGLDWWFFICADSFQASKMTFSSSPPQQHVYRDMSKGWTGPPQFSPFIIPKWETRPADKSLQHSPQQDHHKYKKKLHEFLLQHLLLHLMYTLQSAEVTEGWVMELMRPRHSHPSPVCKRHPHGSQHFPFWTSLSDDFITSQVTGLPPGQTMDSSHRLLQRHHKYLTEHLTEL